MSSTPAPEETAAFAVQKELEQLQACGENSRVFQLPSDVGLSGSDRRLAETGIPVDSALLAMYDVRLVKPQIMLRSDADAEATILISVEEVTAQVFDVNDPASGHRPAEKILSR
jgi:hypothetical protein